MNQISPRVDIAFKKLFGVEENKDLLISLVNSVVGEEDQVADLTILNPYNATNFKKKKLSILDVKAKGIDGKRFNIEIQISDEADYDKRALYYWAKLYTEQLKVAADYSLLSKAIGIHILNFTSIPEAEKYHNAFHITEIEANNLKKAEAKARAEGKAENKREIALAMLKAGLDVKLISKIANLTIKEINKLKNTF